MSSKQNHSSNNQSNSKPVSDYSITKPYGGMKNFMESYGLRIGNDSHHEEAKQIISQMKQNDAAYENSNNNTKR